MSIKDELIKMGIPEEKAEELVDTVIYMSIITRKSVYDILDGIYRLRYLANKKR